jgi:hypothetical protein
MLCGDDKTMWQFNYRDIMSRRQITHESFHLHTHFIGPLIVIVVRSNLERVLLEMQDSSECFKLQLFLCRNSKDNTHVCCPLNYSNH